MGHDQRDALKDYWSTLEQYFVAFCGKTMKRDRFSHILRFLYFSNKKWTWQDRRKLWPTVQNESYIWQFSNSYVKYYLPTKNLAVYVIIVLFKGRVNFEQYIPKKHKQFGMKVYRLCDSKGYAYKITVYLGKDRKQATSSFTATHATDRTCSEDWTCGTQFLHGQFHFIFSVIWWFTYLDNCCATVRPNRKGVP